MFRQIWKNRENSYELQDSHYTDYIRSKPEWQFVENYADDGILGTNTAKRNEFNRMITDCEARKLKTLNIAVLFEKENINILDSKGEVLLTIMDFLAQQELKSLSANVHMSIQFRNQQGKVQINHN